MSKVHSFSDEDGENMKFYFLMVVTMTNVMWQHVFGRCWCFGGIRYLNLQLSSRRSPSDNWYVPT